MDLCVGGAPYQARWTPRRPRRALLRRRPSLCFSPFRFLCFQSMNIFIGCFCRLCAPAQLPAAAATPKPRSNWSEHKENVLRCARLPRGDGFRLWGNVLLFWEKWTQMETKQTWGFNKWEDSSCRCRLCRTITSPKKTTTEGFGCWRGLGPRGALSSGSWQNAVISVLLIQTSALSANSCASALEKWNIWE